jgi:hypothetical protein
MQLLWTNFVAIYGAIHLELQGAKKEGEAAVRMPHIHGRMPLGRMDILPCDYVHYIPEEPSICLYVQCSAKNV